MAGISHFIETVKISKCGFLEGEMETEIERVQLRLVFVNHHILSTSQRKEGLAESWFVFKPKLHKTISDLSDYLFHIFGLHHSCLLGLLLFMDGFALPLFESTCVLKDKDVVRVRKKVGVLAEIDDLDNGLEIVKLLANEEFDKETGGYESEFEEDEHDESLDALDLDDKPVVDKVSKKWKASNSKKLQGSKYAHVNMVVSDKQLVKHLQKEVARLEAELRTPDPSKEKDMKIQQMEMEMEELRRQRDMAQCQVDELCRKLQDDLQVSNPIEVPCPSVKKCLSYSDALSPKLDSKELGRGDRTRKTMLRQSVRQSSAAPFTLMHEICKPEGFEFEETSGLKVVSDKAAS